MHFGPVSMERCVSVRAVLADTTEGYLLQAEGLKNRGGIFKALCRPKASHLAPIRLLGCEKKTAESFGVRGTSQPTLARGEVLTYFRV